MSAFTANAETGQAVPDPEIEDLLSQELIHCNDCLSRGDFPEALQSLNRAVELAPGNPEILTHRGRLLVFLKEFDRARADFDKALQADSNCATIHSGLARCHFEKRTYDLARTCATRARTMDPANQEAGAVLSALEKLTGAKFVPAQTGQSVMKRGMKFPESKLAHKYLDNLNGLEIGGSAHNSFGLKSRNVDYCADLTTVFKLKEIEICGEALKVDVVAPGDELPLPDDSEDFVLSSHVIEHFFDPIKAIKEWLRVVRPGGYVFIIAPHKDRTFDKERPRTPLRELLDRHNGKIPRPDVDTHKHYSIWITEDLLELCRHFNWKVVEFQNADDKVGNGFTILIQKDQPVAGILTHTLPVVPSDYCLKPGYQSRPRPLYFEDMVTEDDQAVWQPDVYPLAAQIARKLGCRRIVDVGCGRAHKLVQLQNEFETLGVDFGSNLEFCRQYHPHGEWIEADFERSDGWPLLARQATSAVVICADVVEHMIRPEALLEKLRQLLEHAAVAVISTPERDLTWSTAHNGPPPNPCHTREWNLTEFAQLLRCAGLIVEYVGVTRSHDRDPARKTIVAIVGNQNDLHLAPFANHDISGSAREPFQRWLAGLNDGHPLAFRAVPTAPPPAPVQTSGLNAMEDSRQLARSLAESSRWAEAIVPCHAMLAAMPGDQATRVLLARCFFAIGSTATAELLLGEVQKHDPGNAAARELLAKLRDAKTEIPASDTPGISVIVPTYNRPERLGETLQSILTQTYRDFEIIVVNDAGPDVSHIIKPLNADGRIRLINHAKNKGLAGARNTGIRTARGRYLAYLDDDDLFYPDHLQTLVEFLASRPGTVAYTDANRAHQELIAGQWRTKRREVAYAKDWDNDQILVDNFVPVLCFMHEKSLLEKSGGFNETLKRHEDWDLWIRLSRHFPFVRLPKVTCEFTWRDNGSSMSGQSYEPFLETMRRIHSQYAAFAGQRPDLLAAQSAKREELEDLIQRQQQTPKLKVGFLSADAKVTACAYLRLTAPLDQLHARREIEHLAVCDMVGGRLSFDEPLLRQARVIVVQRGLAAFVPYHVLRRVIPNPAVKIVFELDDALTLLPRNHHAYQYFQTVRPHLEAYLKNADLVTVSTPKLKELYSHFNENIEVLPNTVDASIWLPVPPKPPRAGKLTILFSGTVTHEHDLALVERAIERIIRKFPERVEFLFWGNAPAALKNLRQIKTVDGFMPNYKDYAARLKTLAVDLAVVPLEMVPFNRAKSPIKWLEYSACKIPGIFTNIEAYNQTVDHGKTGWLVPNTTEAWFEALEKLILDDGLRQSIAENAHKTVLDRHLLKQNTHLWTQAYERILALPAKKISHQAAQASIIIPTFNNLNLTRQCLDSILGNTPQGLYEIIVVDNGSTDGTPAFLKQEAAEGRIRAVFIHQNRGFAHGCNQGALAAQCPHLLFLNNDTVATSGWLTAMLSTLNQPDVGIVGAKLLYANDTIQHAGIGWINGVPDHPFRHAYPLAPEVNIPRELDMVTGACLLIPRALFLQLAGFDETYQNGVEDIDLCLRVRSAGRKVVYEPKAVVYHLEGQSVGRFNHVNKNLKTFFNRWGKTFDAQKHFVVPHPVKIVPASRSLLLKTAQSDTAKPVKVDWIGSFLDHGSLSHVNRELADALNVLSDFQVSRISNGALPSPAFEVQARNLRATASPDAAITVRHAWPPDWKRPLNGKLAVIQPWEFGLLPEAWVRQACDVDEFWVPSNFVRDCYLASGIPAQKVFVVPNGVDAEKFHPQAAPVKLSTQKKFKFLFVGGTIGRKGPDLLLKAYLQNFTAADDVCLVIKDFGGKSFYAGQTFESQIRVAQFSPDAPEILYLNEELPPESLPGLYTACDCFVLPYRGEGFGLPVLEAMACGLPVIVTAGGAADDFVRDEFAWRIPATRKSIGNEVSGMKLAGNGWLLEPDPFVLGKDMRYAFANPNEARERGTLASHHAHQFFSWKNSAMIAAQRIRQLAARQNEPGDSTPVKAAPVRLPSVALVGQLHEARRLLGHKKLPAAWEATVAAIHRRPFHPEAFLLLAEIALAAGDAASARECARQAHDFAPGWNPARQFLKKSLKGNLKPGWLKLPGKNQNRLSVCLIVKNEEKFLDQCLKSIHSLAQQIVVVDTGSTDRTVEIARAHDAEIHSFTWDNDFAAARNAALERVTGDWVLILDADEELPAEQHPHLLADMAKAGMMAYRLPLVNLEHEAEGQNFVPRLFRNAPGVFYSGRIHEQVFPSLVPLGKSWGLALHFGTAQLLHHGYTKQMIHDRDKIRRNLELLTRAVGEYPADANLMMNLGLELVRMNDLAGGVEKYRAAFKLMSAQKEDETAPELREVLLTQFTCQLYKMRAHGEVVQVLHSPLAKIGGLTASLHFALGLALFELKQFAAAAEHMRQCISLRQSPVFSPINANIFTTAPEHCLALSLAKTGDAAGAEKALLAASSGPGRVADIKLDYAKFLAAQNRSIEAFHKLHELVAADSRNLAAWRTGGEIALGRPEFLKFAGNWTAEAMRYVAEDFIVSRQRAETLLLGGDMKMAAELWERLWNSERQPVILAALILCETLAAQARHAPDRIVDEPATSRAFIKWYQKLIAMRAHKIVRQINDRLDEFSRPLPTAVGMLEKALAEPQRS